MRRAKIGDVYAFETNRGYRILQYAYKLDKNDRFVRVFSGFYETLPKDPEALDLSDCSYIMSFFIPRMYAKGLLIYLFTALPETIPPLALDYDISYDYYDFYNKSLGGRFEVCEFFCHQHAEHFECLPDVSYLPPKYQKVKLINGSVDPAWFIYLLYSDFDMHRWDLFYPGKEKHAEFLARYEERLFGSKTTDMT